MTTKNPRVNVTMEPREYAALTAVAIAQGTSRSAVLLGMFREALPYLERMLSFMREAEHAKQAISEEIRHAAIDAELEIMPVVRDVLARMDAVIEATKQGKRPSQEGGSVAGEGCQPPSL